jgi:hypothetical protein
MIASQDFRNSNMTTSSFQRSYPKPVGVRRKAVPALLIVLLLGFIFLAGARDRALAHNLLRFFALAPNDLAAEPQAKPEEILSPTDPVPTSEQLNMPAPDLLVPTSQGECSSQFSPKCSLQQAQTFVDFPLVQFGALPEGVYFQGATVEAGRVTAMYGCSKDCLLWFEQTKADSLPASPATVGFSAQVEIVQFGDIHGEYLAGSYYGDDGSWNSESGASTLRWKQGDIVYTISVVQSNANSDTAFIAERETIIGLASSLTTDLTQQLNLLRLTSITDTQHLAGFDIVEPGNLPEGYQFSFATYDSKSQFVCLHYAYNGASYPSLFLRESPTAALTELKGYSGGNFQMEQVSLANGAWNAIYVTGFDSPDGACDPENNIFRAGQALIWQANGMSFEIYAEFPSPYNQSGFDQKELIQLAEELMAKP